VLPPGFESVTMLIRNVAVNELDVEIALAGVEPTSRESESPMIDHYTKGLYGKFAKGKRSGPGQIRTGDPRHVKAMS
jgi:hypothetical protein